MSLIREFFFTTEHDTGLGSQVKILLVSVSFKNKRLITNMRLKRMLYNQLPSTQQVKRLSKTTREICTNISVFASWL